MSPGVISLKYKNTHQEYSANCTKPLYLWMYNKALYCPTVCIYIINNISINCESYTNPKVYFSWVGLILLFQSTVMVESSFYIPSLH